MNHRMKTFSSLLLWLLAATVWAGPVSLEKARKAAMQAMGLSRQSEVRLLPHTDTRGMDQAPAYYIFDNNSGPGYAIISGEDCLPQVVAYSTDSPVGTGMRQLPDGLQTLLQMYSEYVNAIREGIAEAPQETVTRDAVQAIAPLLTCMWGQEAPYNRFCPPGTPVGCVATAMAQIMYYHQWPQQGTGTVQVVYNGQLYRSDLSDHTYNWTGMHDTTAENQGDETAAQATAQLCYDLGLAAGMEYSPEGSAAIDAKMLNAIYTYFGYMADGLRCVKRGCYTLEEWMDMVRNEFLAGRPVYYAAQSSSGDGQDASGHAFVLDGCDSRNYVHVNWGWDGWFNGYFDITLLNPDAYTFNIGQQMIIGIRPDKSGNPGRLTYPLVLWKPVTTGTQQTTYGRNGSGEFEVPVPAFENFGNNTFDGFATIALYDATGKLLRQDIKSGKIFTCSFELPTGYYMKENTCEITCKLPAGLPNGEYLLRLVFRERNKTEWIFPEGKNLIRAVINGNRVTFDEQPTTGIEAIKATPADDAIHSLDGKRLTHTPKGIYIKGGKKFITVR